MSIGASTASTGAFTTLSASSTVSGTGFSTYLASPPAIGGTTAGAITGTTITANTAFSGALNGTVGATTPAAGTFTALTATGTTTLATSLGGILKATAGVISAATAGTDYVAVGGALGTPSSGTVTNLTGTASININGTVGSTTPAAGAFTTLSASSTVSGTGINNLFYSPPVAIGYTTPAPGYFTTLSSTGTLTFKQPIETVYDLGTTGGTITPNCANGSVQKITINSALTFSAFTSPVAGQSMTLIITNSSGGGLTLTSTMKFSGASKTLSTGASAVDILTVFYDGSTYWASLAKGFA
jgi:hypothetical protein